MSKGKVFKIRTGFFVTLQHVINWEWMLKALVGHLHISTYLNCLFTAANCILYNYARPKSLSQITQALITTLRHLNANAI